jgi:TolB-like protein/Flp pilus assembly protein TadD
MAAGPPTVAAARPLSRTRLALAVGAVVAAVAIAAGMWTGRPASVAAVTGPVDAIAVLPFANLSERAGQEYFADGVTDAIITDLAKITTMRVIGRGSVMQYRTRPKAPADVARELGVDALVDGSVVHAGDRVRISAQIVAPADGRVLWSEQFERDTREILALQSDIARAVAVQVRATLAPGASQQPAASATNPEAHELLLLGRYHAYRKNPESGRKAIEYLQQALAIDPNYAAAHASLADAYRLIEIWGGAGVGTFADESRAAARRALALDAGLAEAHMVMGVLLSQRDWKWEEADLEFRKAIELAPSYSDAHAEYGFFLQGLGRYEAGVDAVRRAVAIDPLSADHWSQLGRNLFRARHHDEAIRACERSLELEPNFGSGLSRLIDVYLVVGRFQDVETLLDKRRDTLGSAAGQTAQLYALTGHRDRARALMGQLEQRNVAGGIAGAFTYIALGEHDRALDSIEALVNQRRMQAFAIRDPRLDPIVGSPRFARILETMNLPK